MQRGPRRYNALSDEERLARLRRKAARKEKRGSSRKEEPNYCLFCNCNFNFWAATNYGSCANW